MNKIQRFYMNIWNGCNLNCSHCFNEGGKAQGEVLSHSEIMRLIGEAQETLGIEEVQITGGEPTQRKNLFPLIQEMQQKGLKVLLQTNGVFNSGITRKILTLNEENFSLIVSLDGIRTNDFFRGQGATERTMENLAILSKKFKIRINTLLSSKITWDEIEELARMAEILGLSLAFNPVCPLKRADPSLLMRPEIYFEWMYRLEKFRERGITVRKCFDVLDGHLVETEECPVRKGPSIHIAADGNTYPCGFLVNNPALYLGSVRELPLNELRRRVPPTLRRLPTGCCECEYHMKGYCYGGCPARSYGLYKRFDVTDFYCMARYATKE
jgi:radical SAM protein with 4Fe4S-binding SPASM domain